MSLSVLSVLGGKTTLRSLGSPVLAVALALFAGTSLAYINVTWNPGYYGEFGYSYGYDTVNVVSHVVAGSPADKAGLKVGDIALPPSTLRERLLGSSLISPRPGEHLQLSTLRHGHLRRAALTARPLAPLPLSDRILLALNCFWLLTFAAAALALVLLRPSKMTWGFYLFALNLILVFGPAPDILLYAPAGWIIAVAIAHDIIAPAGVAGFVIFCVRFPTDAVAGWRKTVEQLAPYAAAITAGWLLYEDIHAMLFVPFGTPAQYYPSAAFLMMWVAAIFALLRQYSGAGRAQRREIQWMCAFFALSAIHEVSDLFLRKVDDWWSIFAVFLLGGAVFTITYLGARGLEKYKLKWVGFGFLCVLVATAVDFYFGQLGYASPSPSSVWYAEVSNLLYLALPFTVAYAVIRHRVIDIRFAISRTLTFGIIASVIMFVFAGIDWLFSTRLPSSHFEAAIYSGLALILGFSLNAARQRFGKTIDFVFFRAWYTAQEQANTIADTINHAGSDPDVYEPLTGGIARVFSLASVALFERIEDGGFVRVAAWGWPLGTAWHIYPDEPLALRAVGTTRVIDIDTLVRQAMDLPYGVARPAFLFQLVNAKRVSAILLCSAHENGTALASDEIRTIRRFCADAGFVYGRPSRVLAESLTTIEHGDAVSV